MKRSTRHVLEWALGGLLALGLPALSVWAAEAKPNADDKCVAQCDEQSDKCMLDAGHDNSKQRQCDTAYDECLRKCS
jgi:hypothetical protein